MYMTLTHSSTKAKRGDYPNCLPLGRRGIWSGWAFPSSSPMKQKPFRSPRFVFAFCTRPAKGQDLGHQRSANAQRTKYRFRIYLYFRIQVFT